MLISLHYLLHVADSILATGPCWTSWQFLMERLCGMLIPLARSQSSPYENITNNIILHECFNHLKFSSDYSDIFPTPQNSKEYSEKMVYTLDNTNKEFWWPSQEYSLVKTEIRKIKECYQTMLDLESLSLLKVILNLCIFVILRFLNFNSFRNYHHQEENMVECFCKVDKL